MATSVESCGHDCLHPPRVHLDNIDMVLTQVVIVENSSSALTRQKTVHHDPKTPLVVLFVVSYLLHWWIIGHLEDELSPLNVVGDEDADHIFVIDEVQHGTPIVLLHQLAKFLASKVDIHEVLQV